MPKRKMKKTQKRTSNNVQGLSGRASRDPSQSQQQMAFSNGEPRSVNDPATANGDPEIGNSQDPRSQQKNGGATACPKCRGNPCFCRSSATSPSQQQPPTFNTNGSRTGSESGSKQRAESKRSSSSGTPKLQSKQSSVSQRRLKATTGPTRPMTDRSAPAQEKEPMAGDNNRTILQGFVTMSPSERRKRNGS